MNSKIFKDLLQRYVAEKTTAEENREIERFILKRRLGKKLQWESDLHKEATKDRMRSYIFDQIALKSSRKKIKLIQTLSIAASLIFLIGLGAFYFNKKNELSQDKQIIAKSVNESYQDVTIKSSTGDIEVLGGIKELDLRQSSFNKQNTIGPNTVNTIHVPSQHQFNVVLMDGTKVWLNAGSSLSYPTRFEATDRNVILDGEAYFEVVSNPVKPFVVNARKSQIIVTGTKFNLEAYASEPHITTSLFEGHVAFKNGKERYPLTPGYQLISDRRNNTIHTGIVERDQVLAWKNGYFVFNDLDLVSVMRHVAKWYNISVTAPNRQSIKRIQGTFPITGSLDDLLRDLERLSGVKFIRKGKEVQVIY